MSRLIRVSGRTAARTLAAVARAFSTGRGSTTLWRSLGMIPSVRSSIRSSRAVPDASSTSACVAVRGAGTGKRSDSATPPPVSSGGSASKASWLGIHTTELVTSLRVILLGTTCLRSPHHHWSIGSLRSA